MNFWTTFKQGQEGKNMGLPTGIKSLDYALDGVQRKAIYGIAAAPKAGKTTFVDFSFVLHPFLYLLSVLLENPDTDLDIEWHYFSYEIDRINKEFDFASFFFYHDYKISSVEYNGNKYDLSSRYLKGRLECKETGNIVPVSDKHKEILKTIYLKRIIPLFGEYDVKGKLIKKGYINFFEQRDNPTGLRNTLLAWYKKNGEFLYEEYDVLIDGKTVKKRKITGYKPNNPNKRHICITDHMRKLRRERGYSKKDNIDKWIEYQVELRNWTGSTFVDIIHLNRGISDIQRIKYETETLYPTGDDIKDTGNLSEECDYLLTMFNPRDPKYKLDTHFGVDLEPYPRYRSIHLVDSRDTECPQHLSVQLFGHIKHIFEI